jgi:hypothetical protein
MNRRKFFKALAGLVAVAPLANLPEAPEPEPEQGQFSTLSSPTFGAATWTGPGWVTAETIITFKATGGRIHCGQEIWQNGHIIGHALHDVEKGETVRVALIGS